MEQITLSIKTKIAAWLMIVIWGLSLVGGIVSFFVDHQNTPILILFSPSLLLFLISGIFLLRRKRWAWRCAIIAILIEIVLFILVIINNNIVGMQGFNRDLLFLIIFICLLILLLLSWKDYFEPEKPPFVVRFLPEGGTFKKAILVAFCCWLLLAIIYNVSANREAFFSQTGYDWAQWKAKVTDMGGIKWGIFTALNALAFKGTYLFFFTLLSFLIVGFYLAFKFYEKHKILFLVFPIVFATLGFGTILLLSLGGENMFLGGFIILGISFIVAVGILSLILLLLLYFKKEFVFFLITGIIFFVYLVSYLGFGIYIQNTEAKQSQEVEPILSALKTEAIESKNINLCDKIKEELLSKNLVPTSDQYWMGKGPTQYWKDYYQYCVKEVAIELGDSSLCGRLSEPIKINGSGFQENEYNCSKEVFVMNNDLCKEIVDEGQKEICIREKAIGEMKNDICAELYDNYCSIEIALRMGNETICKNIEWTWGNYCKQIVTNTNTFIKNTNVCTEVLGTKEKIDCIKETAVNANNPDLCASIYDLDCMIKIAQKTSNPQLCKTFKEVKEGGDYSYTTTNFTDECLNQLATLTQNPEVCRYAAFKKGYCASQIKK